MVSILCRLACHAENGGCQEGEKLAGSLVESECDNSAGRAGVLLAAKTIAGVVTACVQRRRAVSRWTHGTVCEIIPLLDWN